MRFLLGVAVIAGYVGGAVATGSFVAEGCDAAPEPKVIISIFWPGLVVGTLVARVYDPGFVVCADEES